MQDLGNFQAGMGRIGADANVMGAYILASILILIAVALGVMAFVPMKSGDCTTDWSSNNKKENISNATCEKKNYYWFLLISLGLVLLAIFTVWIAKWWKKEISHNKTAQEVGGTLFEAQLVKNILQK